MLREKELRKKYVSACWRGKSRVLAADENIINVLWPLIECLHVTTLTLNYFLFHFSTLFWLYIIGGLLPSHHLMCNDMKFRYENIYFSRPREEKSLGGFFYTEKLCDVCVNIFLEMSRSVALDKVPRWLKSRWNLNSKLEKLSDNIFHINNNTFSDTLGRLEGSWVRQKSEKLAKLLQCGRHDDDADGRWRKWKIIFR